MFLEIGKSYVERFYNGNLAECTKCKNGNLWDSAKITRAFGNAKKFEEYRKNNVKYSYFVNV